MSFQVPDFLTEEDSPVFPRKTHESAGDDFVELIWQKGPIFRRRSPDPPHGDSALRFLSNPRAASGVSTHTATTAAAAYLPSTTELFMEEDEMASWLYYPLGGDDDPGGVGTVAGVNPTEQPRETAAEALPDPDFFPPAAADRAVEADGWAATGRPPRHPQAQGISTDCLGAPRPRPASGESTVVNTSATTTEPGRSRPWAESRVFSGDARVGAAACELGPASSSGLSCNGEEAGASAAAMAVGRGDERKRRAREDDDGCDSHSEASSDSPSRHGA
ncbi:hypothetical protein Taro_005904 [Colocasia esculenta]|uniref:Uncharacterized protein n=1 Tax=Colocasia esculenta TaxID=4460 RepID=A0A843TVP8_COLES|nr:hypothetical protein [Colocasia esculenta]